MTSPFELDESRHARFLERAGEVERVTRSLLGNMRRAGSGLRPESLRFTVEPVAPPDTMSDCRGEGRSIVYLPAVAWRYRFQRPQQLAAALARLGNPVLYVECFSRTWIQPKWIQKPSAPGVTRLRLRVPGRPDPYRELPTRRASRALAKILCKGMRRPVLAIIAQLPSWLHLARELRERLGVPLVYDRLDLHAGFPGVPESISRAEDELLADADLVTASSTELLEGALRLNRSAIHVPNAVAVDDFSPAAHTRPRRDAVRAGYVGALGAWFDHEAIARAADDHPDWNFRLAGRVESAAVAALGRRPNVHLLGEIEYPKVAAFLRDLDVALIPFRDLHLTRSVDPVKLYEAFAVGLPVVARDLPDIARWEEPLLWTYRHPAELASRIAHAVASDRPEVREARRSQAALHTWDHRAAEILTYIARQR